MLDSEFDRMVDRMCDNVAVSHMLQTMCVHTLRTSASHWTEGLPFGWNGRQRVWGTDSFLFSVFDKVGDPKKVVSADSLPGVQGHTYALFEGIRRDASAPANLTVVFVGKHPHHRVLALLAPLGDVS